MSIDIDFYPLRDPGRAHEIADVLGEGSEFHIENGFYLDAVSPKLATLPSGWESRMPQLLLGSVSVQFLEVNDAAISKYARGEPHDLRWLEAGLKARILDPELIRARMISTYFLDDNEKNRAKSLFLAHCTKIFGIYSPFARNA